MKELIELVKEEASKLKKFATKEELDRLDFKRIDPMSGFDCIYGQMTGSCFSTRALELVQKCAIPYSSSIYMFSEPKLKFNEEYFRSYSPIEYFIYNTNMYNNKILIDYLKGKRKTLRLK